MDKYIITIKKDNRAYTFGRYYRYDHERAIALDILDTLFHLKLIDAFYIKEAITNGVKIGEAADVH